MDEAEEYVNNYLKKRKRDTLENEKDLTEEKRKLLNYRMFLIYKKIDESIKFLDYSKLWLAFGYVADEDFVVRLYKKISEVKDKVQDFASMLDQAQNGIRPYNKIISNISEQYPSEYELI